jgi:hypothetical protein
MQFFWPGTLQGTNLREVAAGRGAGAAAATGSAGAVASVATFLSFWACVSVVLLGTAQADKTNKLTRLVSQIEVAFMRVSCLGDSMLLLKYS